MTEPNLETRLAVIAQEMAVLRVRLNELETRPQPAEPKVTLTTRRKLLGRLATGLLAGVAFAGTSITNANPAQARTVINPTSGSNRVGMVIVPPGTALPAVSPSSSYYYGLVVTDGIFNSNPLYAANTAISAGASGVNSNGLYAQVSGQSSSAVFGSASGVGSLGLYGIASGQNSAGIYSTASGTGSHAAYFFGQVGVVGDVNVTGVLSKGGGSFKIDHPLDPANRYLYHSFVESVDMMNIYNGVVTLDGQGRATVELPAWFETLNSDFRYGLTALGQPSPDLHIAQEVKEGKFTIAGGKPGQRVSWQLTGIRQDEWAKAHRIPVEEAKPDPERGLYLHPELYGQPPTKAVHHLQKL